MTKVSATFEKVLQFRRAYEEYTKTRSGQFRPFLYALNKMYIKLKPLEDEFNDDDRLLSIKHCAKDSKGFADMEKFTVERKGEKSEQERMKFKLDDQKLLNKEKRDLLNKEVEIDAHQTEDIPKDLGFDWYALFAPFVVPEEPTEEMLKKLYTYTEESDAEQKKRQEEERQAYLNRMK